MVFVFDSFLKVNKYTGFHIFTYAFPAKAVRTTQSIKLKMPIQKQFPNFVTIIPELFSFEIHFENMDISKSSCFVFELFYIIFDLSKVVLQV